MQQALRITLIVVVLVLSEFKPAIQNVKQAAGRGHGRTRDLLEVFDEVGRHTEMRLNIRFVWVKAHVGIQ